MILWRRVASMLAFVAAPAAAHHSYGMFDRSKEVTLKATVITFEWTNPHSWLHVAVQGTDGALQTWNAETGPPGQLVRSGWKRGSLKPGDKIDLTINPLKDGSPGGHILMVKKADGTKLYDIVFKRPPQS